jgi:hypothetical protein
MFHASSCVLARTEDPASQASQPHSVRMDEGGRKASMKIVPMQREEEMREGRPTKTISPIPAS